MFHQYAPLAAFIGNSRFDSVWAEAQPVIAWPGRNRGSIERNTVFVKE